MANSPELAETDIGSGIVYLMSGPAARRLLQSLMRSGQEARFIGGCVRDAVLGLQANDIDIATPLPPEEVMRRLKQDGIRVVPTGIDHGTVTAFVDEQNRFEITTLRRDVETDGRHAKVVFCEDWLQDAQRRDFTFNAMSLTPEGALFDPFDGVRDLRSGHVRFIGSAHARIAEDVLRILRFFRFYARFGKGSPDPAALAACVSMAPLLPSLSGERVATEVTRILAQDRAVETWRLMVDGGIIQHLLPDAVQVDRLAALDRLEWMLGEADPLARLAALLPDGQSAALQLAERLRFSGAARDYLLLLVAPTVDVHPDLTVTSRRHALQKLGPALFRDLLLLAAAKSRTPAMELLQPLAEAATWVVVPFPLKGRDVLNAGVAPGTEVGLMLAAVEGWWAARDYRPSREECLAELDRKIGKKA